MMRSDTVVQHMKLAASARPSAKYKLRLGIQYRSTETILNETKFISSCTETMDEIISELFDLSLLGYFVNGIRTFTWEAGMEYDIEVKLGFSKQLKSNIDEEVVNAIVDIMDSAN